MRAIKKSDVQSLLENDHVVMRGALNIQEIQQLLAIAEKFKANAIDLPKEHGYGRTAWSQSPEPQPIANLRFDFYNSLLKPAKDIVGPRLPPAHQAFLAQCNHKDFMQTQPGSRIFWHPYGGHSKLHYDARNIEDEESEQGDKEKELIFPFQAIASLSDHSTLQGGEFLLHDEKAGETKKISLQQGDVVIFPVRNIGDGKKAKSFKHGTGKVTNGELITLEFAAHNWKPPVLG